MLVSVSHLGLDLCVIKIYVLLIPSCTNHAVAKERVFIQVTMTQDVSATKVTRALIVKHPVMENALVEEESFLTDVKTAQVAMCLHCSVESREGARIQIQQIR
jgi:hypothetical protein